jgi:5-methylcytosine-specific restriction endonuclease McrA
MIKLELLPKPDKLTDAFVADKTQEFMEDASRSPWTVSWLKEAVGGLSFGKCCYSEIRLGEEGKYMEIDHFLPKSLYPGKVMEWGNLVPACNLCNRTKGDHDTGLDPIVNPFSDNPKDYFYIKDGVYWPKGKSEKGRTTIHKLGLNTLHLATPRMRISEKISVQLCELKQDMAAPCSEEKRLAYRERFKRLLREGDRKKEYAALVSTTILKDTNYAVIVSTLSEHHLWDNELETLTEELRFCSLMES